MTTDFVEEHNIHIVLCSPEYDKPEDKYYKVPRELGILKVCDRTEGISTSDIIKRIAARGTELIGTPRGGPQERPEDAFPKSTENSPGSKKGVSIASERDNEVISPRK